MKDSLTRVTARIHPTPRGSEAWRGLKILTGKSSSLSIQMEANLISESRLHYVPEYQGIQSEALGYLLVYLLVRSHHSLIRLLRTTCLALLASLSCSAALARSFRSLPRSSESELLDGYFVCVFFHFRP